MPDFPLLLRRIIADGRLTTTERKALDATIAKNNFHAPDVEKLRSTLQNAVNVLDTTDPARPLLQARIETLTQIAALAPPKKEDTGVSTCFAGGTLITMAHGELRAIEHVRAGDYVCTFDGERLCSEPVEATFSHMPHESRGSLVRLNGTLVTADHPLFFDGRLISSDEASVGTPVLSFVGAQLRDLPITRVEHREAFIPTYNISVHRSHSFFAGGLLFGD